MATFSRDGPDVKRDIRAADGVHNWPHRRSASRRSSSRWPRLSPAREHALVLAAQSGNERERQQLIDAFRPSIASVARIYRRSTRVEWEELMQEGVVGLLRALGRYDPTLGVPFWAYASWWVRQAMQQLVSQLCRPLVLSDRALRQLARVKDAQRRLEQAHGREASYNEVAELVGISRSQVGSLICAERTPRGLDESAGTETGDGWTVGELLADPVAEDAYEQVPRHVLAGQVPKLLEQLTDRERVVIRARYGLDGEQECTLQELAGVLGVTAERVRQIEKASLEKLESAL
jgi:RNA polymerase primary sigma factor